ncbi:hypothetical protein AAH979_27440 [Plantactinospora sp. ZYX-F-223]|uniref:hypothetical protein n=1 Tax=Plantactinospora sp. ZYX-F-223 TaxID=3144103 RepID=UPI0031FD4FC3
MTMPAPPPPPRGFKATDILSGQVRLHGYPLTFVCIESFGGLGTSVLQTSFAAAELLEAQGWRVVNFSDDARRVFLRREYRPAPPGPPPGQPSGR